MSNPKQIAGVCSGESEGSERYGEGVGLTSSCYLCVELYII